MARAFPVLISFLAILFSADSLQAWEDPTGGRPFLEWVWEDQAVPTFQAAAEVKSLAILGAGIFATGVSFQYDEDIRQQTRDYRKLSRNAASIGSHIGSGLPGIAIAIGQLAFDQKNGLQNARALTLTSISHASMAFTLGRERPNKKARVSFPSGHTSSAFASATSLAYSYGWAAGVPAFAAAGLVASSKLADNQHWFTDVVFGATLGLYWGRASRMSSQYRGDDGGQARFEWAPILIADGAGVGIVADF